MQSDGVPLLVNAPEGTELFVLDGRLEVVRRGNGTLKTSLDPGIYKIRAQAGPAIVEDLVILRDGIVKEYNVPIVTAAPLTQTAEESEPFSEAMRQISWPVHGHLGSGGGIAIVVRWDRWRNSQPHAPASGFALEDAEGKQLFSFEALPPSENPNWDSAALELDPGTYAIRSGSPHVRQSVVVCKGWMTQVFFRRRATRSATDIDHENTTILMRRDFSFRSDDSDVHRIEMARLALKYGRQSLSSTALIQLLDGNKFADPIWGILGGHLLLQGGFSKDRLKPLVATLRRMVGRDHPDVEGLAFAAGMGDDGFVLRNPPMLYRSWSALIVASLDQPDVIPRDTIAAKYAEHFLSSEPWLLQRTDAAVESQRQLVSEQTQVLVGSFADNVARRLRENAEAQQFWLKIVHKVQDLFSSSGPKNRPIPSDLFDLLPYDERRQLLLALGMPRVNVEDLIKSLVPE